jgi:hypothetical protein
MVILWWLVVCTKNGIQDENVQIGKHLYVSIAAIVNLGMLQLMLPTGNNQDLQLLK